MLSYQVASLRRSIEKLTKQRRPPAKVIIKREMAEYLGVKIYTSPPYKRPVGSPFVPGVDSGSLVSATLVDLYAALKTAKGIDETEVEDRKDGYRGTTENQ